MIILKINILRANVIAITEIISLNEHHKLLWVGRFCETAICKHSGAMAKGRLVGKKSTKLLLAMHTIKRRFSNNT